MTPDGTRKLNPTRGCIFLSPLYVTSGPQGTADTTPYHLLHDLLRHAAVPSQSCS